MKFVPYENLRDYGIVAHKVSIWRWERAGQFPKRVRVSAGRIAWVEEEIESWLAARAAERNAAPQAA
jgi:prophage regulatory protein